MMAATKSTPSATANVSTGPSRVIGRDRKVHFLGMESEHVDTGRQRRRAVVPGLEDHDIEAAALQLCEQIYSFTVDDLGK